MLTFALDQRLTILRTLRQYDPTKEAQLALKKEEEEAQHSSETST